MKTLLLSMPFGAIDRPALGISLLKTGLLTKGYPCEIGYPLEYFVRRIGLADYKWLTDGVPYTCFAGDWCFTLPLYGRRPDEDWAYVLEILRDTWAMSATDIKRVLRAREATIPFLQDCLKIWNWSQYDIVGFTSTFVQNIASLALAKLLKREHPHITIVFGGSNWEDDMGRALFDCFPFVDYVCQGEADESFPALVAALSRGKATNKISGVLSRRAPAEPSKPVTAIDNLPFPDFTDFFEMHQRTAPNEPPILLMETSRGCWWGAKHHCTFCGLNGRGMGFRSKSPTRALNEMKTLSSRHDVPLISMVDNILDMRYFETVIPLLATMHAMPSLFYETKANLSRKQVTQLAKAKIFAIQPGIESLSDRVLHLMRKGTTALRNIQLLKWCREQRISVEWNILYGFPGETDADYDRTLELMPLLAHLQPPSGSGPVRIDRFSPFYETPSAFGLRTLQPLPVFSHLYRFADDTVSRIACYFNADYEASSASPEAVARLIAGIEKWQASSGYTLAVSDSPGLLRIADTRWGRQTTHNLIDADRLIYLLCDRINTVEGVIRGLKKLGKGMYAENAVSEFLDRLVEAGLMVSDGRRYLALGVFDRFPTEWDQTIMSDKP